MTKKAASFGGGGLRQGKAGQQVQAALSRGPYDPADPMASVSVADKRCCLGPLAGPYR